MSARVKVACVNWSHPSAPHAMAYALLDGEMRAERYFKTWAEAVEWAHVFARRLERAA